MSNENRLAQLDESSSVDEVRALARGKFAFLRLDNDEREKWSRSEGPCSEHFPAGLPSSSRCSEEFALCLPPLDTPPVAKGCTIQTVRVSTPTQCTRATTPSAAVGGCKPG